MWVTETVCNVDWINSVGIFICVWGWWSKRWAWREAVEDGIFFFFRDNASSSICNCHDHLLYIHIHYYYRFLMTRWIIHRLGSIFHQMVELLQLKNWHHFLTCRHHQKSLRHGNSGQSAKYVYFILLILDKVLYSRHLQKQCTLPLNYKLRQQLSYSYHLLNCRMMNHLFFQFFYVSRDIQRSMSRSNLLFSLIFKTIRELPLSNVA